MIYHEDLKRQAETLSRLSAQLRDILSAPIDPERWDERDEAHRFLFEAINNLDSAVRILEPRKEERDNG